LVYLVFHFIDASICKYIEMLLKALFKTMVKRKLTCNVSMVFFATGASLIKSLMTVTPSATDASTNPNAGFAFQLLSNVPKFLSKMANYIDEMIIKGGFWINEEIKADLSRTVSWSQC
jgi:hypothetical protein